MTETSPMGKVLMAATIQNLEDLWAVKRGTLSPDQVQVPLELLDLVVDPRGGTLLGNPAHGGEHD